MNTHCIYTICININDIITLLLCKLSLPYGVSRGGNVDDKFWVIRELKWNIVALIEDIKGKVFIKI